MPTQVLLAPVGAGKTRYAITRLVRTLDAHPFARVWVLVSGKRQEDAFRQRLVDQGRTIFFNVEFFNFYQLYHRLLNIVQQPPRMLDDAARYGLLRAILADLSAQQQLGVFEAIAGTPGFVRIMAEFIYELKQNLITPEDFSAAAVTEKDREIALIYSAYQQTLQQHALVDREGEGWLALDVLQGEAHQAVGQDVDLLLVDGYDQFTPLQASLLMLVADRARDALITLANVPGRTDTVGRRFTEALHQLQTYSVTPPEITESLDIRALHRPAELRHVMDQVFLRSASPQPANERIVLLQCPQPRQEAEALMRRVKRLLLAGAQPDDILIALRDWPRYAGHFAALDRAYGIPLALHQGEPLHQNPAVMSLLTVLALHENDFRRRDLLDVLRSAYFEVPGIGQAQVDQLEQISQQLIVTGGRANWFDAVRRAGLPVVAGDGDEDTAAEAMLDAAEVVHLYSHLEAFFRQVTPPQNAPLTVYIGWLHRLIGPDTADPDDEPENNTPGYTLNVPARIRQGATRIADRDILALDELMRVLRSLLAAETLLGALDASREMDRGRFLLELRTAVNNTNVNRGPVRSGRVLVTTVTDARGLPHKHVLIPGLSEGIFPAPLPENTLYLDSERIALRERGIVLETQAERAADDGLFYQLIGIASESLTLSRPTVQDGAPWPPSHLWRAVSSLIEESSAMITAHEMRMGQVARTAEAATSGELLLSVADCLTRSAMPDDLPGYYAWVQANHAAAWGRVNLARAMELRRLSRRTRHDHYSGRLHEPDLIAVAARQLGPHRVWSATQLNDYGICGYRFFAKRLLRLEALEEPEDGLDAAKLGTVNHAILEATYAEAGRAGLAIVPENLDTVLAILRRVAQQEFEAAPGKLGFADDALWQQECAILLRRLETLVSLDFSDKSPMKKVLAGTRLAWMQEAPFGLDGALQVSIPVEIDGQTEALLVQGKIDRVDRSDDGFGIIDYKSGTTKIPVDEMRGGRNFQMMVYLHAAQQILAEMGEAVPLQGGLFWHIRNGSSSGDMRLSDAEALEALEEARTHIGRAIAAGRRGDFTVQPRKLDRGKCVHYCEFSQLCRAAGTSRYKPEGADE